MLAALKRQWHGLRRSPPGHRFQNRYANARKHPEPAWRRALLIGAALVLGIVGVVFAFIPGPAILFFALAGALLAGESRVIARGLDWTELRLRALLGWAKRRWRRLGGAGRMAVGGLGLAGAVGGAFAAWHVFLR